MDLQKFVLKTMDKEEFTSFLHIPTQYRTQILQVQTDTTPPTLFSSCGEDATLFTLPTLVILR